MTTETSNARGEVVAWFPTNAQGEIIRNYGDGSPVYACKTKEEAEQASRCHLGATGPVIPLYAAPPPAAAQQQGQPVAWVSEADIAPFVGAPQMAAFWGTVTLASGPGDGRTVPLYLTAPPSAPVGVEAIAAEIRASLGRGATVSTRRRWAVELEALALQPAAAEQASGGCKGPNCTASVTNDHKHSSECLFEHAANVASGIKSVEMGVEIAEHLTYVEWRGNRINLLAALAAQHQEPTT